MHKLVAFLKKYRTYGYILITVLLIILLTSVCRVSAREDQVTHSILLDREALFSCTREGYELGQDESGASGLVPVGEDPYLLLPEAPVPINRVTVAFQQTPEKDMNVQLGYAAAGAEFNPRNSFTVPLQKGQISLVFYLAPDFTQFRICTGGMFLPESVTLEQVSYRTVYAVNPVPLVLLLLLAVALFVFDKKIGYVSFIRALLVNHLASVREDCAQKGWRVLVPCIGMWCTSVAYAGALLGLMLFSYISKTSMLVMFALTVAVLVFQLWYRAASGRGNSPAKLFLVVVLAVGLLFAYVLPVTVGTSWDDQIHYYRSEQMSRFMMGHQRTLADIGQAAIVYDVGTYMRSSQEVNTNLLLLDDIPYRQWGHMVNFYTYIAYFHLSGLIAFADLISMDFILKMTLLKMLDVLVYSVVVYAGLKKLKSGAYLFAAICLMPTCVFLAASINYDYWVTAFIAYAMAVFLSELQQPEKPMSAGSTARMLTAMAIGCGPKAIYFAMMIPFLMMDRHKFIGGLTRKKYIRSCLIVMGLIVLSFLLPFVFNMEGQSDLRGGADVNSLGQVRFILTHPIQYTGILLRFLSEYLSLNSFLQYNSFFAYLGNPPVIISSLSLCLLAFCTFTDKQECDAFRNVKLFKPVTLAVLFVQIALFATALYVSFTPVGLGTINGCQWRYLIPVLFLLLYCLGSCRTVNRMKETHLIFTVFGGSALLLMGSLFHVYLSAIGG